MSDTKQNSFIPDDMICISKLEYEALLDENKYLRNSLRNQNDQEAERELCELSRKDKEFLELSAKHPENVYILQVPFSEHISRERISYILKSFHDKCVEINAGLKNVIFMPITKDMKKITVSKICKDCPYKPKSKSWLDVLRSGITDLPIGGKDGAMPETNKPFGDLQENNVREV